MRYPPYPNIKSAQTIRIPIYTFFVINLLDSPTAVEIKVYQIYTPNSLPTTNPKKAGRF